MNIIAVAIIVAIGVLGSAFNTKPEVKKLPPIEKALESLEPTPQSASLPCGLDESDLDYFKTNAKNAGYTDQEITKYLTNDCQDLPSASIVNSESLTPTPIVTTAPYLYNYDKNDDEDSNGNELNSDSYQTTNGSSNVENDLESDVDIYKSHKSTSYQRIGNFTYGSDGSSYQKIGNFTYGSDGSSSQKIGNTTYVNSGY
jgi:hypothetical protein